MRRADGKRRRHLGCIVSVGLVLLLIFVAAVLSAVAWLQIGSIKPENHAYRTPVDDIPASDSRLPLNGAPLLINLRADTVSLMLTPTAEGGEVTVEADYDPAFYRLTRQSFDLPGRRELRIALEPSGSRLMAILRGKLGARLPTLRIGVPADVSLEIVGEQLRSFSFIELGGGSVERIDLRVTDGSLKLSAVEPTRQPLKELELYASKVSIGTSSLGNASPRRTQIETRIGVLELDLRGAWVDDGRIDVVGAVAGGSIWLPDNVQLVGIDEGPPRPVRAEPEIPLPRLTVDVDERVGRILVVR